MGPMRAACRFARELATRGRLERVARVQVELYGSLALTGLGQRMLRFLLAERTLAIHRIVIAESVRFPELGRAFYDNGPGMFRRVFAAWLVRQQQAGRLAVPDPDLAADQFVGMLRGAGVFTRATLGLAPGPTEAEINATVEGAVRTFLRAFAVRA